MKILQITICVKDSEQIVDNVNIDSIWQCGKTTSRLVMIIYLRPNSDDIEYEKYVQIR